MRDEGRSPHPYHLFSSSSRLSAPLVFLSSLILHPSSLSSHFLDRGGRDRDDVLDRLLEGVVVRDDEELVEVSYLPYLLRESLAALCVHVDRRLVEEGDAYVGELLQKGEPHRQGRDHLLAARHVDERALVPAFFEHDVVVLRPPERTPALARYLSEEKVCVNRNVVEVALGDERPGLAQRVAYEVGRRVQLLKTFFRAKLLAQTVAHLVEPRNFRRELLLALARSFELR